MKPLKWRWNLHNCELSLSEADFVCKKICVIVHKVSDLWPILSVWQQPICCETEFKGCQLCDLNFLVQKQYFKVQFNHCRGAAFLAEVFTLWKKKNYMDHMMRISCYLLTSASHCQKGKGEIRKFQRMSHVFKNGWCCQLGLSVVSNVLNFVVYFFFKQNITYSPKCSVHSNVANNIVGANVHEYNTKWAKHTSNAVVNVSINRWDGRVDGQTA